MPPPPRRLPIVYPRDALAGERGGSGADREQEGERCRRRGDERERWQGVRERAAPARERAEEGAERWFAHVALTGGPLKCHVSKTVHKTTPGGDLSDFAMVRRLNNRF